MERIKELIEAMSAHLGKLAKKNAVVAKPITVGKHSVIPLCELSVGFGGGGGSGEAEGEEEVEKGMPVGKGSGGGAGGSAKAAPVAIIVVEDGKVRMETLDG